MFTFYLFIEEDDDKWLTKLNACKWLKYVSNALRGAASLAKILNYKNIQLAGKNRNLPLHLSSKMTISTRK